MQAMTGSSSIKMTAAWSTLLIFGVPASVFFAGSLDIGLARHDWGGAIVSGVMVLWIFAWWRSYSVEINDGLLTYRKLFSRRVVIRLADIKKAENKFVFMPKDGMPPNRLEIQGAANGEPIHFAINLKPFKLTDVHSLLDMVGVVKHKRTSSR